MESIRKPFALSLAVALAWLAGCSSSENTPPPGGELRPAVGPSPDPVSAEVADADERARPGDFYALELRSLEGEPVKLSQYRGKVALVVNVASQCGYTPQYAGLQALYEELGDQGLVVIGMPCNDFGGQEPGSPEEIRAFCSERYQVTFPMLAKVQTRAGSSQSEAYRLLGEAAGELPSWNFGKYLVGKDGRVLGYFPSGVTPESTELREAIVAALES